MPVLKEDPILQLGREPITENVTDASVNHDQYLYNLCMCLAISFWLLAISLFKEEKNLQIKG
ncbi:MAG: hypothetical protein AB1297_06740 [bacterium]